MAGCSQRTPSSPLPAERQSATTFPLRSDVAFAQQPDAGFKSVYNFAGGRDASNPFGVLLLANGTFYSNTLNGGKNGVGTVYKVSTSGKESVLYSFAGPPADGRYPIAGLAAKNGEFYGTTGYGGTDDLGTVFKVSASGVEHVLHTFTGPDGENPQSGLVLVNGAFYSTTQYGGADGIGAVFKVSTSGAESVIYSFNIYANPPDGRQPVGDLILVSGTLYGTTLGGGSGGVGTVFKVSTSGTEHVLYNFKGSPDGSTPYAGLINLNGTLYGATQYGGASGNGTVFKVSTAGAEHVIYSFKGTPDGATPYARLVALNGTLYGTTYDGGASGNGIIFKVSTSGVEKVLYSFTGLPYGGSHPIAGMTAVSGALYGTTSEGGKNLTGMVYKLTP
ncbi:MAG: choice-of-anchor tandem repeat GloVer-containing protein [Candidatus Baltobacteraceae bacterium]